MTIRLNTFAVTFCVLWWVGTIDSPMAWADETLTIQQALDKARSFALEIKRAQASVESAKTNEEIVRAQDLPKLTANASLGAKATAVGTKQGDYFSAPSKTTLEQQYALQANAPIFDFGRQQSAEHKADLQTQSNSLALKNVEEGVFWAVLRAYLKVQAADAVESQVNAQLKTADAKRDEIQRGYRNGLHPENDLVRAQFDQGRARIAEAKAAQDLLNASIGLSQLIGASIKVTEFKLRDVSMWKNILDKVKEFKVAAAEEKLNVDKQSVSADRDLLKAQNRPQLNAVASMQLPGSFFPLVPTAQAALQLSWDIPWAVRTRDEDLALALKEKDIEYQTDISVRNRKAAVDSAKSQLEAYFSQLDLLTSQKQLSERLLLLTRKRYEAGKASMIEFSQSEDDVINARLDVLRLQAGIAASVLDFEEGMNEKSMATDLF